MATILLADLERIELPAADVGDAMRIKQTAFESDGDLKMIHKFSDGSFKYWNNTDTNDATYAPIVHKHSSLYDSNYDAEHLILDTAGNVAIGGASYNNKLNLIGNMEFADGYGVLNNIYYSSGFKYTANGRGYANYSTGSGNVRYSVFANNTGGAGAAASEIVAMSILQSNGYVGLGTDTPSYRFTVNGNGYFETNLGVGVAPSTDYGLRVADNKTNAGAIGTQTAAYNTTTADSTSYSIGLAAQCNDIVYTGKKNSGYVIGVASQGYLNGPGNIALAHGARFDAGTNISGTGTIDAVTGVKIRILNEGGGTITDAYGIHIYSNKYGGSIGTMYGIYIDGIDATTGYGIYQDGTDDTNYFAGNVGIGETSPAAKLHCKLSTNVSSLLLEQTGNYNNLIEIQSTTNYGWKLGKIHSDDNFVIAQDNLAWKPITIDRYSPVYGQYGNVIITAGGDGGQELGSVSIIGGTSANPLYDDLICTFKDYGLSAKASVSCNGDIFAAKSVKIGDNYTQEDRRLYLTFDGTSNNVNDMIEICNTNGAADTGTSLLFTFAYSSGAYRSGAGRISCEAETTYVHEEDSSKNSSLVFYTEEDNSLTESMRIDSNGNIILDKADSCVILGNATTDGSWKLVRSGNNLLFQRLESSSWVTKSTLTP